MTSMDLNTKIMKRNILAIIGAALALGLQAQPRYDMKHIQREKLDRGVVAVPLADGTVAITWRTLFEDRRGEAFDVYRNGVKLNHKRLTTGGTYYIDSHPLPAGATYEVRGGGVPGSFSLKAGAPVGYLPIALQKPADGVTPDGKVFSYSANDASVGDVDGDGQYEIILKLSPSNERDNSHNGFTGPTLFDCYRLDGTRLWRIDMGANIRSGAHYVPFLVYDFDGDGRAELMVKTADGTIDGTGRAIGDPKAVWCIDADSAAAWVKAHPEQMAKIAEADEAERQRWAEMRRGGQRPPRGERPRGQRPQPGQREERPQVPVSHLAGRVLSGPEYVTVFNGLTGEAMATADYIPERGDPMGWGDERGNRSERYLAAVGYLDGRHASAIFCRGYYTRTVLAAWDWDGKALARRWVLDSNNPGFEECAGQGNHNIRVADVDGDGCDEITYGSMAVDHDGSVLYNTRKGHGDAMHLTAFDPSTDHLQLWDCHENRRDGSELRDASTGKTLFQIDSRDDVGRCMAADIDPLNPGLEMWSSDSHGLRNIHGSLVLPHGTEAEVAEDKDLADNEDDTALYFHGRRLSTNSAVWWDGDLLRELLDHNRVEKYDWATGEVRTLMQFDGCQFNNGTKSNPCLSADLLGDWREEVLVRTDDSRELRLYVTPHPTDHRITCLMQDMVYRHGVTTQNVGYNQPPHTGFYLGPDKGVVEFLK